MKKRFVLFAAVFMMAISVFSTAAFAFSAGNATAKTPWYAQCTSDETVIRDDPDTSGKELARMGKGDAVEIIEVVGSSWYRVRYTTGGATGYVSSKYLTVITTNYGYVAAVSGVNIKSSQSSTSTTYYKAPFGRTMPFNSLKTSNNIQWAHVVCGRTTGYVDTGNDYDFRYEELS